MADATGESLAAMVHANDKLLKALTILLALKDRHLLGELRTIFQDIISEDSELGAGDTATWAHLRHELELITTLVEGAEDPFADDHGDGLDDHDNAPLN